VLGISLIVDGGWKFSDGIQTVLIDNVMINNKTYTFESEEEDQSGKQNVESDRAFRVLPFVFDPDQTNMVDADWGKHQGLPDQQGDGNEALLLTKLGKTSTNAASGATITNVKGITLTEIGWDVRDDGHCGAGAPRFNVVTSDNVTHFIGCNSPAPLTSVVAPGSPDANGFTWHRKRYDPATAFPPIAPGSKIESIAIIFDEGVDQGQGYTFLDNIDINGTLIGQGPDTDEQG